MALHAMCKVNYRDPRANARVGDASRCAVARLRCVDK